MTQSRKYSLIEGVVDSGSSYFLAVILQCMIFPYFGFDISVKDSSALVAMFTAIGFVRKYLIRRLFSLPWFEGK